jgi:hypothetical protein
MLDVSVLVAQYPLPLSPSWSDYNLAGSRSLDFMAIVSERHQAMLLIRMLSLMTRVLVARSRLLFEAYWVVQLRKVPSRAYSDGWLLHSI